MIELPVDEILDRIHRDGWLKGAWYGNTMPGDGSQAACLHGHIRRCNIQPGDAYLVEQVANQQGWGPRWNDAPSTTVDDLKPVLVDHRDITDRDLEDTFGPQWRAIVVLVRRAATLTKDEGYRLAAAWAAAGNAAGNAARDAARAAAWNAAGNAARAAARAAAGNAARDAARAAAWNAAWAAAWAAARAAARAAAGDAAWNAAWDAAGTAAGALVVRDLVGRHRFTREHYDTLTRPWATVVGKVHPDD